MVPKWLARVNIAQVYLDNRRFHHRKGVAQGERVVSQRAWIDNNAVRASTVLLQVINERPFMIRLEVLYCYFQLRPALLQHLVNLRQGHSTIDGGFAGAQGIKVWAI